MEIKEIQKEIHAEAQRHGWWDAPDDFPNLWETVTGPRLIFEEKLFLIGSELTEVLEEIRIGKGFTEVYYPDDHTSNPKPEGIPIELADVAIRLFDLCGQYGIDLEEAITRKIAFNKTRSYRHGGKVA